MKFDIIDAILDEFLIPYIWRLWLFVIGTLVILGIIAYSARSWQVIGIFVLCLVTVFTVLAVRSRKRLRQYRKRMENIKHVIRKKL